MRDEKRIMKIAFSRYMTRKFCNFDPGLLIDILKELPKDSTILALAENAMDDTFNILLQHDSFPELQEATRYPNIECIITDHYLTDGTRTQKVSLEWPEEYKANHKCQYKTYQGFSKIEDICAICGKVQ